MDKRCLMEKNGKLTLPLCAKCHARQGAGESAFWDKVYDAGRLDGVLIAKAVALARYLRWKEKQK